MTAPVFEFTDRARPVVEMGRSARADTGNRWGEGLWGSGLWGVKDWEILWTDLTCEIHQIDVDTGRGGATDRFVPGTATITASNVNQISDLIFPPVEDPEGFPFGLELVPQPPITHEEDLQAPDAATIVSNGWSFTDDFETAPPRWVFPSAYATTGTFPTVPMLWADTYVYPETYPNSGYTAFEAHGVAQWTGIYTNDQIVECAITVDHLVWAGAPTSGSPSCTIDLYAFGTETDQACNRARVVLTPNFSGNNTAAVTIAELDAAGTVVSSTATFNVTTGIGTGGDFGELEFRMWLARSESNSCWAMLNGFRSSVYGRTSDFWATGTRLGFAVHYVEGTGVPGNSPGGPHVVGFEGPDFEDDFARPVGSGWKVNKRYAGYGPMIQQGGTMRPPVYWVDGMDGGYEATGSAQFTANFDGDQALEVEVVDLSMPAPLSSVNSTNLELSLKGFPHDLRSVVAALQYNNEWGTNHCTIDWILVQYGPTGEWVYDPDVSGESFGTIDLGATQGVFPDATWRVEADTAGEVRLYYQDALLGHATFPNIPTGTRIGVYESWGCGRPITAGTRRGQVARLQRITGGLREPLGTEELGMCVRIGVHHDTQGTVWLFRGFVDGIVPTYDPERPDKCRIECFDSLGEAGRVEIDGDQLSHRFLAAPGRIRQILDAASWPKHFRAVGDDATLMSRPSGSKAVDALTQVAESCGGAVYGDPDTGDVVFKGQDWQGPAAAEDPQAWITNYRPDFEPGVPRICPSGWDLSSQRSDMTTRVKFSTATSDTDTGDPIVREWRWPAAERLYGVEKYERTLLCIDFRQVNELAFRQLRLRNPNQFPRVEAVQLDAATEDECLDLMTSATFTIPSKYHCQLRRGDGFVFNRNMLVTGVSHTMTRERWTCRLTLDPSHVFYDPGVRWGQTGVDVEGVGRWGVGEWGRAR